MKVLEVKNINKSYGQQKVINNFSMEVGKGEIVAIIGPSGVGKTTLLRCISNLETIDDGEIIINNVVLKDNKKINKIKLDIGYIFQDYNLFPQYSVSKNIILSLTSVLKMNKEEAKQIVKKLLSQMKLSKKENSYPYQLSGGEKQRVAIARAVATNPKILCFDEPTSALDSELIKEVYTIIKNLANEGKAIIIVTHDINFAKSISNRIIEII